MKNKKGFTLIELLAVIAILAVVMLIGGQSVFGALDSARKGSFKTEVGYAIQAAQSAYQVDLMNQKATAKQICYPLSWLMDNSHKYYDKSGNDAANYKGSVLVTTTNVGAGTASYKVWMYNTQYMVKNGTLDNLSTSGTDLADGVITAKGSNATTNMENCNGLSTNTTNSTILRTGA